LANPPRVWVADVGDEEFPKARLGTVARRGDKRRKIVMESDKLVHLRGARSVFGAK
jgi:hypothetical protein